MNTYFVIAWSVWGVLSLIVLAFSIQDFNEQRTKHNSQIIRRCLGIFALTPLAPVGIPIVGIALVLTGIWYAVPAVGKFIWRKLSFIKDAVFYTGPDETDDEAFRRKYGFSQEEYYKRLGYSVPREF